MRHCVLVFDLGGVMDEGQPVSGAPCLPTLMASEDGRGAVYVHLHVLHRLAGRALGYTIALQMVISNHDD